MRSDMRQGVSAHLWCAHVSAIVAPRVCSQMPIRLPGGRWSGGRRNHPRTRRRTPLGRAQLRRKPTAASRSQRSPSLSSSPSSSLSRPTASTGWSATTPGRPRSSRRREAGEDVSEKSGLQEIFEEISPIEDFSETMSLSFENPVFYDPKYTVDECKEKDFTYSAPLYVSAEFTNNETGEIKGQTVFMGDFPLMTRQGHLHHQRHRARRRLAARPFAGRLLRAHRRQDVRQGHLHRQDHPEPRRLARVRDRQARHGRRPPRPQAQAERHGAAQGPRLDQRADPRGVRPSSTSR